MRWIFVYIFFLLLASLKFHHEVLIFSTRQQVEKIRNLSKGSLDYFDKNGSFDKPSNGITNDFGSNLPASVKVILGWTNLQSWYRFGFNQPWKRHQRLCSEKRCMVTSDKEVASRADAIVFHIPQENFDDNDSLPKNRQPGQRYVYFTLESPYNTPRLPQQFQEDYFNWTMTYRTDSDVHFPFYGHFQLLNGSIPIWSKNYIDEIVRGKTKSVVWFVSNCRTNSKREYFVKELRKHNISIDIYGSCGKKKCSKRSSCEKMLIRDYKFYLAFENSVCQDYATEKFFAKLAIYPIVPVVLNRKALQNLAPQDSFIAADDFHNPKDLVQYLKYLSRNTSAYLEYFDWQRKYQVVYDFLWMCDLCRKLWNADSSPKVKINVDNWFHNESTCFNNYGVRLATSVAMAQFRV